MIAITIIVVLCGLDIFVTALRGTPPHVVRWEYAPSEHRFTRALMALAMMCLGLVLLAMMGNLWQAAKIIGAIGFVAGGGTALMIFYIDGVECKQSAHIRRIKQNIHLN